MELERIDNQPSQTIEGYQVRPGKPLPFGVTTVPDGMTPWNVDWNSESRQLGWLMSFQQENEEPDTVYVAANSAHYATWFDLPQLPEIYEWNLCFNTGNQVEPYLKTPLKFRETGILVGERSIVIFTASPRET